MFNRRPPLRRSPLAWLPFLVACAVVATAVVVNRPATREVAPVAPAAPAAQAVPALREPARPVTNNCSGGVVYLTFDDGPLEHTPALLDRLKQLNLKATFFVIGDHVAGREDVLRREVAEGHSVQNHSFHHFNLVTGVDLAGVTRSPWGESQVVSELLRTNDAIVAAGVPAPTEYRPPYGAVDDQVDDAARRVGLRLIMPWSDAPAGNIADSHDTETGVTAEDIVANLTPGIRSGAILAMHDGEAGPTLNSIAALQGIVDVMNRRKLCSSVQIRPDATGGVLGTASTGRGKARGSS